MAEQLRQNDIINNPQKVGTLNFYNLGATTIKQFQEHKLINYRGSKFQSKKPDALLVKEGTKEVLVFIENKDVGFLDTDSQIKKAYAQEIEVAIELGCPIFILTDTTKSYWYNVKTGNLIKDTSGDALNKVFDPYNKPKEMEKLITNIINSIDTVNDQIKSIEVLDPSDLARKVHQRLYMDKSSSPQTALYTFVELFLFKYLSDLGVLTGMRSFDALYSAYDDANDTEEDVLNRYLTINRQAMMDYFPAGEDGTSIINGDIFHVVKKHDGTWEKNGDGTTFKQIMVEFKKYEDKNGKFININKDFKSKLFESFLKNESDKQKMGQFFTPLKVIEQIVRMVDIKEGMKIIDPASGVGKFVLEPLQDRINEFYSFEGEGSNIRLNKKIELRGYDKYSDDNSDRTIILAKANMLIYFSKLLSSNPTKYHAQALAKDLLNETFILKRGILGSLEKIEEEEYDLILTNPPYVVNGSGATRIQAEATGQYSLGGLGLEALFMEWIMKSTKQGGSSIIVLPDGILTNVGNKKLRQYMLDNFIIDAVISLPPNTFFGTPKKTYILKITKKVKDSDGNVTKQTDKVFTYIANSIGEELNVNRFDDLENNDLENAVNHYNLYKAYPVKSEFKAISEQEENEDGSYTIKLDKKMKLIDIEWFYENADGSWDTDRNWSDDEKVALGLREADVVLTVGEFKDKLSDLQVEFEAFKELLSW